MTLLLLTLAYVAVAVLLLNVGLRSHWRWTVKLAAIVITSVFYLGTWYGLQHLQGWPVAAELPAEFRLVSKYIQQPDKQTGSEGSIYLWVVDLTQDNEQQPRAYRLPYVEQLHADVEAAAASKKQKIGKRVEKQPGTRSGKGDSQHKDIIFVEETRPRLPAKN